MPFDPANPGKSGQALAIDGDTVLVGAPDAHTGGGPTGGVYFFECVAGVWDAGVRLSAAQLSPTESGQGDEFGGALDSDSDELLVGVPRFDGVISNGGGDRFFSRVGSGGLQVERLVASQLDVNEGCGFATALCDGQMYVAGYQGSDSVQAGGSVQVGSRRSLPVHFVFCFGVSCPCGNDDPQNGC